jgi:hypothetical protein
MKKIIAVMKNLLNLSKWKSGIIAHPLLTVFFWCLLLLLSFVTYRVGIVLLNYFDGINAIDRYTPNSGSAMKSAYLIGCLLFLINFLPMYFIGWFCLKTSYNSIFNNPFTKANIISLKILGILLILTQLLRSFDQPVLIGLIAGVFSGHPDSQTTLGGIIGMYLNKLISYSGDVLFGCFLIVLSVVFKKGFFIKEENDLTV